MKKPFLLHQQSWSLKVDVAEVATSVAADELTLPAQGTQQEVAERVKAAKNQAKQ